MADMAKGLFLQSFFFLTLFSFFSFNPSISKYKRAIGLKFTEHFMHINTQQSVNHVQDISTKEAARTCTGEESKPANK